MVMETGIYRGVIHVPFRELTRALERFQICLSKCLVMWLAQEPIQLSGHLGADAVQ